MAKPEYLMERIRKDTVKNLRRFERKQKLKPSISNTIDYLLSLTNQSNGKDNQ